MSVPSAAVLGGLLWNTCPDKLHTFTSCSESARSDMGGANTDLADDQLAKRLPKHNSVSVLARTTTRNP